MTTIANRYRLIREVGRGGTGVVWLAEDTVLRREVAVKRIGNLPGHSKADLDRVRREAHVSARLNHEHVVVVYDLVEEHDEHWLVMEYVESKDLAVLVRDRGPLPPDEAADLIRQTAVALAAAHAAGIVHRDVKPSNLLVTPEGVVKLSDFGIARLETDNVLTQTGMVVGSPAFLAPEVAGGAPASPASDMWSLGATVFHAVDGVPPYPSDGNVLATMYRIVHEEPPRPAHAGWLAPLVEHLMLRDPEARWDANRVREFLDAGPDQATATRTLPVVPAAVVAAEPPAATPPRDPTPVAASSELTREGTGRRRWLVVVAAVAAIALVVAAVVLLTRRDHTSGSPATSPTHSSSPHTPSPSSSSPSRSRSPSTTPSGSGTPSDTPSTGTASQMTGFVSDYYATAPQDSRTTFGELTPKFQRKSGGYDRYRGFWDTIESASLSNVVADEKKGTVSFDVSYKLKDGSSRSGSSTLDLVPQGGSYLIDAEHPRG